MNVTTLIVVNATGPTATKKSVSVTAKSKGKTDPPKTSVIPNMRNGCISVTIIMFSLENKHKIKST